MKQLQEQANTNVADGEKFSHTAINDNTTTTQNVNTASFKFAFNPHGRNKNWDFEVLASKYQDAEGTLDDLISHVKQGHALLAGLTEGKRRCKSNVVGSQVIMLDIDNSKILTDKDGNPLDENNKPLKLGKQWVDVDGKPVDKSDGRKAKKIFEHQITIKEALEHPFIKEHAALIYTTSSHKRDWDKFRIVFVLPQVVYGGTVEVLVREVMKHIPHDPACKDASRVFYGNTDAQFPLKQDAVLPGEWITQSIAIAEREEKEREQLRVEQQRRNDELRKEWDKEDFDSLVLSALSYIPPRQPGSNNYHDCLLVLMALNSEYGSVKGQQIAKDWSPSIPGTTWNLDYKFRSISAGNGQVSIGTLFHIAKQNGYKFPEKTYKQKVKKVMSNLSSLSSKVNCHATIGELSQNGVTIIPDIEQLIQLIVINCRSIFESSEKTYIKGIKLDCLYLECKDVLTRKRFDEIVQSELTKFEEIQKEDELRFEALLSYEATEINWKEILPAPLARQIIKDAKTLNIDPVMLWQSLLAATSSLSANSKIQLGSRTAPSVNWTVSVLESGFGKSRADSVIFAPIRKMQMEADTDYKEAMKAYKENLKDFNKKDSEIEEEPVKPSKQKHIYEVATIQAVMRRLSEQESKGAVWARDELKGLFSSLGQFTKGDNESSELLLSLWDNKTTFVDRVSEEDSFAIARPGLSISGGIQPAVFSKAFKDEEDGNGLQARFLFAVPKPMKKQAPIGEYQFCELSDTLPVLYNWLQGRNSQENIVSLSSDAKQLFKKFVNNLGDQIEQTSKASIRNWLNKADTHLLRICLILHLLECHYSDKKNLVTIEYETLARAIKLVQYYRSSFTILQEKVSPTDDIASIMLQIVDEARKASPDGVSTRDIYRKRHIANKAKAQGRKPQDYVLDLFERMAELDYGHVVRKGKSVRFIASINSVSNIDIETDDNDDNEPQAYTDSQSQLSQTPVTIPLLSRDNSKQYGDTEELEVEKIHDVPAKTNKIKVSDRVRIVHSPGVTSTCFYQVQNIVDSVAKIGKVDVKTGELNGFLEVSVYQLEKL